MATDRCIFNDDPQYMLSLIGKSVEITTTDKKIYKGAIYVIDPQSKTVVLANPCNDTSNYNLDFILYHAIENFNILDDAVNANFLMINTADNEELESKKARLKRWLEENLLDVQEEADKLIVCDVITIEYPYGPEECLCNNPIVLERIRKIINRMPSDYV